MKRESLRSKSKKNKESIGIEDASVRRLKGIADAQQKRIEEGRLILV